MAIYLGLDGGGTKTAWAVVDADGALVRSGEAAGLQVAQLGVEVAGAQLRELLARLVQEFGQPAQAVGGFAGAGTGTVRRALEAAAAGVAALRVVGDVEVAAAAALPAPGVAVWSGTGSFAVARDRAGRLHRAGGRGWLLDDEGSGFDLVRSAAIAGLRAADGRAAATRLGHDLAAAFGIEDPLRLGPALAARSPGDVAAALPVVLAAARADDAAARAVLAAGANRLAQLALTVAERARLGRETLDVALGGGVLRAAPELQQELAACFQTLGVPVRLRVVDVEPALGAARLARAFATRAPAMSGWLGDA